MHSSLKNYFFRPDAQFDWMKFCFKKNKIHDHLIFMFITYISFSCFNAELTQQIEIKNYLIKYASKWFVYHCVKVIYSPRMKKQLMNNFEISQDWKWFQRLFKHYDVFFDHFQIWQTEVKEWVQSSDLADKASLIFDDFLLILSQKRNKEHSMLLNDDFLKLSSMTNLALTYWNQERWKETEKLKIQIIKTNWRMLKKEHSNTLINMINFASTYKN